ncbi:MAG: hypothetical protein PVSMB5_04610 [Ktedonobacteraceae bacterium]
MSEMSKMKMPKLLTIGVYGFTPQTFFAALVHARTDLFCDLRFHRGMRGSLYSFANSKRLQQHLAASHIRYQHCKDLAPAQTLRQQQEHVDRLAGATRRTRPALSQAFVEQYEQIYLSTWNASDFIEQMGPGVNVVALFCVEQSPTACHRSLVADKLAHELGLEVEHIVPVVPFMSVTSAAHVIA